MTKKQKKMSRGSRAALIAGLIALPLIASAVSQLQGDLSARLFLYSSENDDGTYNLVIRTSTLHMPESTISQTASSSSAAVSSSATGESFTPFTFFRKFIPTSATQFFPVTTAPVVHYSIPGTTSQTGVSSSSIASSGINSISTFIQQLFNSNSTSSSSIASVSSASVATSSSSSSAWTTSSSVTTSSSSSSSSWMVSSVSTTSSSSSAWSVSSETFHYAASSSSPATCNTTYTEGNAPAGSCCDGNDNNYNGMIDMLDAACTGSNSTSSSSSSSSRRNCNSSGNPSGDDDGDGVINAFDPDCY